jgi:hypothetical protein
MRSKMMMHERRSRVNRVSIKRVVIPNYLVVLFLDGTSLSSPEMTMMKK